VGLLKTDQEIEVQKFSLRLLAFDLLDQEFRGNYYCFYAFYQSLLFNCSGYNLDYYQKVVSHGENIQIAALKPLLGKVSKELW
jgi:hypothetical protein